MISDDRWNEQVKKAERLEGLLKWKRAIPWSAAALFGLFWMFDVGDGPLDADRVGSVAQWITALVAVAGVFRYLSESMREEHQSIIKTLMNELPEPVSLDEGVAESLKMVPIMCNVDRHEEQVDVSITVANYSPSPLVGLRVTVATDSDWTGKDINDAKEGSSPADKARHFVQLGQEQLLAPSTTWATEIKGHQIPESRWGAAQATIHWHVGTMKFRSVVKLDTLDESRSSVAP